MDIPMFILSRLATFFVFRKTKVLSARISSGALIVAAELKPANVDLFIAAYTLFPAALGLLMISTLGFVGLAYVHISFIFHKPFIYLKWTAQL